MFSSTVKISRKIIVGCGAFGANHSFHIMFTYHSSIAHYTRLNVEEKKKIILESTF